MNVIERINMLKKMVKEAERIVAWQETIYTALHNIHADWVVSGTIAWARLAANFPRTIAVLLSDHNLAHHVLGTIVPHDALANLTERAHGSLTGVTSDQHHPQAHTLASHSTKAHNELTGVTAAQHHAKTTTTGEITSGRFPVDRLPAMTDEKIWKGTGGNVEEVDMPTGVPSGVIAMWHGTIANIPTGWVICDGNNSTPNLLAKFVQGVATAATNPGATGGNVQHSHTIDYDANFVAGGEWLVRGVKTPTDSADGRPPYYDIAFIMKT